MSEKRDLREDLDDKILDSEENEYESLRRARIASNQAFF